MSLSCFRRCPSVFFYIFDGVRLKSTTWALHVLLAQEVEVDGVAGEFWFRIGETNICFYIMEFALVIELEFGDLDSDLTRQHELPVYSFLATT